MNKKIIAVIVAVIAVIIAVLIAITVFNGKDEPSRSLDEPLTAGDLAPYMDKSEEEIEDMFNTPLTNEQENALAQAEVDTFVPEVAEILPDDDPTDNKYEIVDVNGDIYEVEDPFLTMTDEQAQKYLEDLQEAIANSDGDIIDVEPPETTPNVDQELIDAGFEATPNENTETGTLYTNPNVIEDDDNEGISTTFPGQTLTEEDLATGIEDPYDTIYSPIP